MSDERTSSLARSGLSDNPIESLCASAGPCRSNAMRVPQALAVPKRKPRKYKGSSNKRRCVSDMVVYRTMPMVIPKWLAI